MKVPFSSLFYVKRTETRYKRRGEKKKGNARYVSCCASYSSNVNQTPVFFSGSFVLSFLSFDLLPVIKFPTSATLEFAGSNSQPRQLYFSTSSIFLYTRVPWKTNPLATCESLASSIVSHRFVSFVPKLSDFPTIFPTVDNRIVSFLKISHLWFHIWRLINICRARDENNSCRFLSFCRKI